MQVVYWGSSSNWIICNPWLSEKYLMPGKILKTFSKSNKISCPTIWGNYSSGYIAKMQLNGHIGVVLIKTGWECPSIWSFSSPSYLSKKDSVIFAAFIKSVHTFYLVMIYSSSRFIWKSISLLDAFEKEKFLLSKGRKTVLFCLACCWSSLFLC